MPTTTASDTEDGWSAAMMAAKEKLLAVGAENLDDISSRVFYLNGHYFRIQDDGEIDEL